MTSHKPNHECRNCRKMYYACNDCEQIHSWKTVCCSVECFDEYTEKIIRSRMKNKVQEPEVVEPVTLNTMEQAEVTEVKEPKVQTKNKMFKKRYKEVK